MPAPPRPRLSPAHFKFAAVAGMVGLPYLILMHVNPTLLVSPYRAARDEASATLNAALSAAGAQPPPLPPPPSAAAGAAQRRLQ